MRHQRILTEHDFIAEILPISLVGILLNVVGRQLAELYSGSWPFFDMTGTALTAFLLGPWWGASVAAATTLVNGTFFTNYFPYGVVNIAGALVWGYIARAGCVFCREFNWDSKTLIHFLFWGLVLIISGAVVCALASSCVKLILYPALERPFVFNGIYLSVHASLQQFFGAAVSEKLTLVIGDIMRDIGDKSLVVPVAMILVVFTRIAPLFARPLSDSPLSHRIRTDIVSIFVFGVMYSAFLFLAQVTHPTITVTGSQKSVAWLEIPTMVVFLYFPLVFALLAFRFFTYRPKDQIGRRIYTHYRQRREATRRILKAAGNGMATIRSALTQSLGLVVTVWPVRDFIEPVFGVPLILGIIIIALGAYLVFARTFYSMLREAITGIAIVRSWMKLDAGSPATTEHLRHAHKIFRGYLHVPEKTIIRRNELLYTYGFLNSNKRGLFEELLFGRLEHGFGDRIAALAVVEPPGTLSDSVLDGLASIAEETSARVIAVSTSTAHATNATITERLRKIREIGAEVILFDWKDIISATAEFALAGTPRETLRGARARALRLLDQNQTHNLPIRRQRAIWLADRALPSVRSTIHSLPNRSFVVDLGAGYGRHVITAAMAGHQVLAVDRKENVLKQLHHDVAGLGLRKEQIQLIYGDFLEVSRDSSGPADLVICTGVLQHCTTREELWTRLMHMTQLATQPAAQVYIEMLFDVKFDGAHKPDRITITVDEFEEMLKRAFPHPSWSCERTFGPMRQLQSFNEEGRSFEPSAETVESIAAEYLMGRLD